MRRSERLDAVRHDAEALLELPELNRFAIPTLRFTAPTLTDPLAIGAHDAEALQQLRTNVNWAAMSSRLTSQSGGSLGQDASRVLTSLKEWLVAPPETVLIPPSRAVTAAAGGAGGLGDEWDPGGAGLIDQLQRLKAPAFDERHYREREDALRRDLRSLLEDDTLDFNVPTDRSTVTIQLGGEWFPLQSLGTGTEHAVVMVAARHAFPNRLLCLEEPDAHLHPRLQRRLVSLLGDARRRRMVVATHSAHMIDAADVVVAVHLRNGRTSVDVVGDHALFDTLRALGYRASDLLQTNCIIWVEGPSDRIYLLHWLTAIDPNLVEGVDFSIAFYGGALLARLSAAVAPQLDDPTLVDLWRINRRMWIVMDSDRGDGELKPAVQRLQAQIRDAQTGGTWVTSGYTIENYVDADVLESAVRAVHPSVARLKRTSTDQDPLKRFVRDDGKPATRLDKVTIALEVCKQPANLDVMDLRQRVAEVARFIRETPDPVVPPLAAAVPGAESPE
jgi:hypothetical protein